MYSSDDYDPALDCWWTVECRVEDDIEWMEGEVQRVIESGANGLVSEVVFCSEERVKDRDGRLTALCVARSGIIVDGDGLVDVGLVVEFGSCGSSNERRTTSVRSSFVFVLTRVGDDAVVVVLSSRLLPLPPFDRVALVRS